MLKIGVSSCFLYPDPERNLFRTKQLNYLENDMANYLSTHNAMPILIPDLRAETLPNFLEELDGFVFQGGADLAPETYGEAPIGRWKGDAYRDAYELKLMEYAVQHKKPILGICRGMQLLNVFFGGTLYQDIQTQKENTIQHRDADQYDQLHHEVEFIAGSVLEHIYANTPTKTVNSVHHQAVKDLGDDVIIEAISPQDNIVEAIQWTGASAGKVYGVQWHPEFSHTLENQVLKAAPLYQMFLQQCLSAIEK